AVGVPGAPVVLLIAVPIGGGAVGPGDRGRRTGGFGAVAERRGAEGHQQAQARGQEAAQQVVDLVAVHRGSSRCSPAERSGAAVDSAATSQVSSGWRASTTCRTSCRVV